MVFCDSMKTEVYVMSSCDQMRLYETSESFDCTFRVEFGSNPSEHKVCGLHKSFIALFKNAHIHNILCLILYQHRVKVKI